LLYKIKSGGIIMKKKGLCLLLAAVMLGTMLTGCSKKAESTSADIDWTKTDFNGEEINLLCWEQYADPSFVEPFEEKYNCKVEATFFASGDDLVAKLKAGGGDTYDVISPSGDMAGYLVEAGMTQPIDLTHISGWADIPDTFKLADMEKDGGTYGVPYLWGPDYVMYNADVITEPIKSWSELWDEKYKGRLSLHDDVSNIYMIGQMLGLDKEDELALYNMSDEDLAYAQEQLTTLNASVRKYWAAGGELEDLFKNGEIDIAVGWPSTLKNLQDQGLNMAWCIPEEGVTGWFDRWMIVDGSKHTQLATLWIDWCTSAEGEALGSIATTFSVSNPKAADYMDEDQKAVAMVDDMDTMFESINFWSYVENRDKYNEVWTAVKTTK
jgi:putative spermidine/putrescine transport system substrate-binding protein/spermidine/putrescine transport system substrate-binding protein